MTQRFTTVLAAVDGSGWTKPVLEAADLFARTFGANLHVIHAEQFLPPAYFTEGGVEALQRVHAEQRQDADAWLRGLAGEHLTHTTAQTQIVEAPPVAAILDRIGSFGADLVVLGTHGRTGINHLLLGSVAERVVRESPVPVLTVRRDDEGDVAWHPPVRRIICPVNFSDVSLEALRVATDVASQLEAELTVLYVAEGGDGDEDLGDRLAGACDGAVCSVSPKVVEGDAAEAILEHAVLEQTDLIVVGAEQRSLPSSRWPSRILGTTSVRVLRHASCPVLSVPPAPGTPAVAV